MLAKVLKAQACLLQGSAQAFADETPSTRDLVEQWIVKNQVRPGLVLDTRLDGQIRICQRSHSPDVRDKGPTRPGPDGVRLKVIREEFAFEVLRRDDSRGGAISVVLRQRVGKVYAESGLSADLGRHGYYKHSLA